MVEKEKEMKKKKREEGSRNSRSGIMIARSDNKGMKANV